MPNQRQLKDKLLKVTRALPASTTAVASTGISLDHTSRDDFASPVEFLVTVPAVTQAQLPDAKTFTYTVETDDNSSFSSAKILYTLNSLTQTGSTGAAGGTERFRLPTNCEPYVRLKVTPSASGTGDASGVSATMEVLS